MYPMLASHEQLICFLNVVQLAREKRMVETLPFAVMKLLHITVQCAWELSRHGGTQRMWELSFIVTDYKQGETADMRKILFCSKLDVKSIRYGWNHFYIQSGLILCFIFHPFLWFHGPMTSCLSALELSDCWLLTNLSWETLVSRFFQLGHIKNDHTCRFAALTYRMGIWNVSNAIFFNISVQWRITDTKRVIWGYKEYSLLFFFHWYTLLKVSDSWLINKSGNTALSP